MKTRVEESQQSTSADYDEPSVAEVEEPVDCPGATHCLLNISASVSNSVSILTLIAFVKPWYARLRNIMARMLCIFQNLRRTAFCNLWATNTRRARIWGKSRRGLG